ncbi:MAG: phosphoglucosamine mutase [Microthrixaceae bacterium]
MHIRFGTDGVRGEANSALTVETALALGRAAARVFPTTRVVIGRDTRRSGSMLESAVAAGVCAEGADAVLLGVVPTPAVASVAAREHITGVMISASHNPFYDNGIKLFAPSGRKLTDAEQAQVEAALEQLLDTGPHVGPVREGVGTVIEGDAQFSEQYLESIALAIEGRSLAGLKVVLDCAHGSNSVLGPMLLERLGAEVCVLANQPDGFNINHECGSTSVAALSRRVLAESADLGIAFDGDADRLLAVDAAGQVVDGDHIIGLCALDLSARSKLAHNTVVVTVMSNLGFLKGMQRAGITVVQTAVGDRNVLQALAEGAFSLGGEQSGHIIFSDYSTTGDGLLGAVVLLDLLRRSGRPLAELAQEVMTRLPQVLLNVPVLRPLPEIATLMMAELAAADAELGDTGRVLLRPSGTEPVVRVMVEAERTEDAQRIAEQLVRAVQELAGDQ